MTFFQTYAEEIKIKVKGNWLLKVVVLKKKAKYKKKKWFDEES